MNPAAKSFQNWNPEDEQWCKFPTRPSWPPSICPDSCVCFTGLLMSLWLSEIPTPVPQNSHLIFPSLLITQWGTGGWSLTATWSTYCPEWQVITSRVTAACSRSWEVINAKGLVFFLMHPEFFQDFLQFFGAQNIPMWGCQTCLSLWIFFLFLSFRDPRLPFRQFHPPVGMAGEECSSVFHHHSQWVIALIRARTCRKKLWKAKR